MLSRKPFFIVGCVRSGTTFLRNVLRRHPNLASPEETHFYRWAEPFGTPAITRILSSNKTLIEHRERDGITEDRFKLMLYNSISRANLYQRYMHLYIKNNKPTANRWFDKTPQNVYGAAMIASEFPQAKFIHIVRNPLDVVSSLKIGKVIHIPQIVGACNYWTESIEIMKVIKRACPKRVYEIKYENLTADFRVELSRILEFIEEEYDAEVFADVVSKPKRYDYSKVFTQEEYKQIEMLCRRLATPYGYFDDDHKTY
jgi:hypothetical protein